MRVTIKDIARMAGVSISTVSRVINNSKPVSEEARKRVLDVLRRTNYPPSVLPNEDGPSDRSLIGVVAPHNSNSVLDEFISGIRSVSRLYGCDIVVTLTDESAEDEAHHLRLFRRMGAAGIIFIGTRFSAAHAEALGDAAVPCVLAGQRSDDPTFPSVHVDNAAASYEAVAYLIQQGHRDIAMICGAPGQAASAERAGGYLEALRDAGIEPREDRIVESGSLTIEAGMRAMERIADAGNLPTAVFCATDWLAIGAVNHLRDRGIRVPEDVSVFGFDGSYMSAVIRPRLSTVEYSAAEIGMTAARSLIKLIKGGNDVPPHANVTYRLVLRESTAKRQADIRK